MKSETAALSRNSLCRTRWKPTCAACLMPCVCASSAVVSTRSMAIALMPNCGSGHCSKACAAGPATTTQRQAAASPDDGIAWFENGTFGLYAWRRDGMMATPQILHHYAVGLPACRKKHRSPTPSATVTPVWISTPETRWSRYRPRRETDTPCRRRRRAWRFWWPVRYQGRRIFRPGPCRGHRRCRNEA